MKIRHNSHALPRDDGRASSDAVSVITWSGGFLAALADGAGTSPAAREAAEKAVNIVATHYRTHPLGWTPGKALRETVRFINRTLWNESHARYGRTEMVSKLVVALYDEGFLTYLGIGDSRVYHLRGSKLAQLTADDTDPALPMKLTRALGAEESIDPTTFKLSLEPGDVIFLCSDGVHHHLSDPVIAAALLAPLSARHILMQARDASPVESRDDCAAIRIDVKSLGWSERREVTQLPIPNSLVAGGKIEGGPCYARSGPTTGAGWPSAKGAGK